MKVRKFHVILKLCGKLLLAMLFIVVITVLLSIAAAVIALKLNPDLIVSMDAVAHDPFFVKAALWAQIIGFISGVYVAFVIFERRKGWNMGLKLTHFIPRFGIGLLMGVVLISLSGAGIWLFGGVEIVRVDWHLSLSHELGLSLLLFMGVALNEELFARGYLQGLVKYHFGAKAAIAVSTIVFTLLHSFNPGMRESLLPSMNLLLAGLLFGLCREYSGSLWMPIGLHLSWNFMQGCVLGFDVSGIPMTSVMKLNVQGPDLISGGAFGAEGSLVTSFVIVLGLIMIYNYYQTHQRFHRLSGGSREDTRIVN